VFADETGNCVDAGNLAARGLEHYNSRFESIRFFMRIDSNRFVLLKKSAFRFTSCYAVSALNK